MIKKRLALSTLGLFFSLPSTISNAGDPEDAAFFRQIFLEEAKAAKPSASATQISDLFFTPDTSTERALKARTLDEALEAQKGGSLTSLKAAEATSPRVELANFNLKGKRLTVVLVPGVFAEFIKNRAMEEVLERASSARSAFKEIVAKAKVAGNANAVDYVHKVKKFDPAKAEEELRDPVDLDEVIHVGEVEARGAHIRVLLLNTPFGTTESLGDASVRAEMFVRRLEKFLELTGKEQPLAFVGYSRGSILGLEMLAQGKLKNRWWVKNVKAMVSLSGVVLGSTLADDATKGDRSPTRKLLEGVKRTANSLEKFPEGASMVEKTRIRLANDVKWAAFGAEALLLVRELTAGQNPVENIRNLAKVDPRVPIGIFLQMWDELGLNSYNDDYSRNIDRFRHFVNELLASVHEIATDARVKWFNTHELPKNATYYALTAAMADPGANALEKQLYANPYAYGSGSQDDIMLTQNRRDYVRLSNGLALNDSQMGVIQSSFPAGVIESLNSSNSGLKTKFLGIAGTHHWGIALREVNKMRAGQVNGFPREALLKAISIQVLLDN